jgi:hypothetical protein
MKVDYRRKGYSRKDVAHMFGVTPARVSQIAKTMGVSLYWKGNGSTLNGFIYRPVDVARMAQRNTKPGKRRVKREG